MSDTIEFNVFRQYCLHREGSKFYQVWNIVLLKNNKTVEGSRRHFTHWGKRSVPFPNLAAGTRKQHQNSNEVLEQYSKKKGRGYDDWKMQTDRVVVVAEGDFVKGALDKMINIMGGESVFEEYFEEYASLWDQKRYRPAPIPAVKQSSVTETTHADWGTW